MADDHGCRNQKASGNYRPSAWLLMVSAMVLLARTLAMHVGGLAGVGRMVVVLTCLLLAIGLWKMHNGARVFLFFLLVSDIIGCLMALFLYALRQSQYRLAVNWWWSSVLRRFFSGTCNRRASRALLAV